MKTRIPALDGLRGIAISIVILRHFWGETLPSRNPLSWGWIGVDLFFVLSGFLIGGILWETRSERLAPFYIRRARRILPVYLLIVALDFLLSPHHSTRIPLIAYLSFSQNWFFALTLLRPAWLTPTWSLAIEEQFYIAAPWIFRRLSKGAVIITLVFICIAAAAFRGVIGTQYIRYVLTICRADDIAIGCLVAFAWREPVFVRWTQQHRTLFAALWITIAACCWWMLATNAWEKIVQGYALIAVFFAVSLWLALTTEPAWLAWAPLRYLGKISYGLYLYNLAILDASRLWIKSPLLAPLVAGVLALIAAQLSWEYLERPVLETSRHKLLSVRRPLRDVQA